MNLDLLYHIQISTQNGSVGVHVKVKTIKLLKESVGVNFHDLGLGNDFLGITPKV